MKKLQPPDWVEPKGYANGVSARGTLICVGGQIGWNALQQFESDDFIVQTSQALRSVEGRGSRPRAHGTHDLVCSRPNRVRCQAEGIGQGLPRSHGPSLPSHDLRRGIRAG